MRNIAGITVLAVAFALAPVTAQEPLPSPIPTDPTPVPTTDPLPSPIPEPTSEPLPSPIPEPTSEPAPPPEPTPVPSFQEFVREHPKLGHEIRSLCDRNRDGMLTGRERSAALRAEIERYKAWVREHREAVREAAKQKRHGHKGRHAD